MTSRRRRRSTRGRPRRHTSGRLIAVGAAAALASSSSPSLIRGAEVSPDIRVPPFLSCEEHADWASLRAAFAEVYRDYASREVPPKREELLEDPVFRAMAETAKLNVESFVNWNTEGEIAVNAGFSVLKAWAENPTETQEFSELEQSVCFFGRFTCIYTWAWSLSLTEGTAAAVSMLLLASQLLQFGQYDWTEHAGWPVNSWHALVNVFRLNRGLPFLALPRAWSPVDPLAHLVPSVWPLPVPQPRRWAQRLNVFYIAMHVVPFSDILTFVQEWWSPRGGFEGGSSQLNANYMGYPRCCPEGACSQQDMEEAKLYQADWRIPFCCRDPFLYNLLGIPELHDHSEGQWAKAYRHHELQPWAETKATFRAQYHDFLAKDVDLILCGHPLYWCTLFEDLLGDPVRKAMVAVFDQPPFFLVPEEAEPSFGETLRNFADPTLYPNVAVVGFAPFFARQFEWTFGRPIPHSRPIALIIKDVWRPTHTSEVLISTSIDRLANNVLIHFAAHNAEAFVSPEGEPLRFMRWEQDLGYETPKSALSQMRAVAMLPYDFAHFKLPEFVAMGMPIFMHTQLWKWTVRWSQLIARPGGQKASLYRQAPEACYPEGPDVGLPMPEFPEAFWRQPWGTSQDAAVASADDAEAGATGDACLAGLREWDDGEAGPPYGRSPFGLYSVDRRHLQPLDSSAFWSRWSEMSLIPHTVYFDSAAHLIDLLRSTPLAELVEVSKKQRSWHRRAALQVVDFWRGLVGSLLEGDASAFKGRAGAGGGGGRR